MEREDAYGNTEVETQTVLIVAGVAVVVVVAVGLLVLLLKRNKKQHLAKVPTKEESVGSLTDYKQEP